MATFYGWRRGQSLFCRHGYPFNCPVCSYNLSPRVVWENDMKELGFMKELDNLLSQPEVQRICQLAAERGGMT